MKTLGMKDVSDWVKIIVVLAAVWSGYVHLTDQVAQNVKAVQALTTQTARIERYLSSKDSNYWQTAAQVQGAQP